MFGNVKKYPKNLKKVSREIPYRRITFRRRPPAFLFYHFAGGSSNGMFGNGERNMICVGKKSGRFTINRGKSGLYSNEPLLLCSNCRYERYKRSNVLIKGKMYQIKGRDVILRGKDVIQSS